jgi:hypothetical protein
MTVAAALPFLIMQRYAALGKAASAEAYKLISAGMAIIPPDMPSHCLPVLSISRCFCSASSSPKVLFSTSARPPARPAAYLTKTTADSGTADHHLETSKIRN